MKLKELTYLFGTVFVVIGILGFALGITSNGKLLGLFEVDATHNIIHLLSGVLALTAAWTSAKYAKLYFQIFGVVYGLVTVAGFIQGDIALGIIGVNLADNLLHLVITATALAIGFGMKAEEAGMEGVAPPTPPIA